MIERVFLDANILVSAAWRAESGLLILWQLPGIQLLTSGYAIVEADRNVSKAEQRTRLHRLVQRVEIVESRYQGGCPPALPYLLRTFQSCWGPSIPRRSTC